MLRFLVMLVLFSMEMAVPSTASRSKSNLSTQNHEVQAQLKLLNKPAVKSIKGPDGDIIDCIKLAHQPAFAHPLFKNHKIQMTPNFHPERAFAESKVSSNTEPGSSRKITQVWHLNGRCPEGTIPMRRTKEDDLLRASSVKAFGKKRHKTIPQPRSADPDLFSQSGHQHAIAYVDGDKYYGAKATINVWEPKIQQPNEFSLSQIWLLGGSFGEDLNSIEAGWQALPSYLTTSNYFLFDSIFNSLECLCSDAYQATGCYNLLCSGFIQINNEIAMGASIYPISGYHSSQYDISLLVWKDPKEGNWWLQFGNNYVLGYWPAFLFSYLSDSASMIEWGGEVVNSESDGQHTSTQMGSGHFPNEGFGKASYFKNIQIVDGSNNLRVPKGLETFTEQSSCYDVETGKGGNWGSYFYYGGPGRNPNCP
ncbi:hypothetical protein F3Y22_tig00110548pilonHSYRG00160 [Hibiscus syriacus]|uniref:Neprosin PEP catalytic domain-containing protein n=1 Tax=Hibiscus syriacus TaxID=106335 RepID=A0A6A3AD31_HIBSY|nr:hypothetical protein F3Y22_tig00110548pilonHSYRG00160 [Hibiscus syriacus]